MKLAARVIIPALLGAAHAPSAASERGPGYIADVQVDDNNAVFWLSGAIVNKPACAVWERMIFDITTLPGQAKLAYLLTARAANRPIKVYGTGTCSVAADHETVHSLRDG